MSEQVNIRLGEADAKEFNAIAAAQGMSRAALGQRAVEEFLQAQREGRAMFEPAQLPFDAKSLSALTTTLESMAVEFERLTRDEARRSARLLKELVAREDGNRSAMVELNNTLIAQFAKGSEPFTRKLTRHLEEVTDVREEVLKATREPAWLDTFDRRLTRIEASAKRQRRNIHFELLPNLKLRGWELCSYLALTLMVLWLVLTMMARILPFGWIATPTSIAMYGSAETAICELNEHAYRLDHCPKLVRRKGRDEK